MHKRLSLEYVSPTRTLKATGLVTLSIAGCFSLICYERVAIRLLLLVDISEYIKAIGCLNEPLILPLVLC